MTHEPMTYDPMPQDAGQVEVQEFPGMRVLVLERTIERDGIGAFLGEAFAATAAALAAAGAQPAGPPVARYDMVDDRFVVQAGFPVAPGFPAPGSDGLQVDEFGAGPAASLLVQGPYELLPQAYERVSAWLGEHGYQPDGRPWEQYLDGPQVAQPRTVVWWPCARA